MSLLGAARRRELAAFLRSRRQRCEPETCGLEPGNRLAPGLRREEVATLAGVSLSWYTWLEQARDIHPSAEVLASIARALRLDDSELDYLLRLGGHSPVERSDPGDVTELQALTDGFLPNPAAILTPSFDYVAWNRASEQLVPGFLGAAPGTHNLMRFVFCGDAVRNPVEGPREGPMGPALLVARMRASAARHPGDAAIGELAEELSDVSPDFAHIWRRHDVPPPSPPADVRLVHPGTGKLAFGQVDLRPERRPELSLIVFLPRDNATAAGMARLVAAAG